MTEQQNFNHPQLRKIKRPINRMAPQNNSRNFSDLQAASKESGEINNYLDANTMQNQSRMNVANFIEEDEYNQTYRGISQANSQPEWLTKKALYAFVGLGLLVGFVCGSLMFKDSKVVRNGLQGVIFNTEVPRGRARCGVAERSQGCVLYLMNSQQREIYAKDFYDLAAQLSGRQRFIIETGNMRYANTRIKPGEIVQLNIPPL